MTKIVRVVVIGAGTMGRQISLQIARHGFPVTLYDIDADVLAEAESAQRAVVAEWIALGELADPEELAISNKIRFERDLRKACDDVDLAIEAVPEQIELKRSVFAQLDRALPAHAILTTNSSSIRVSLLEAVTERPERVANFHFYLPVWDSRWSRLVAVVAPVPRYWMLWQPLRAPLAFCPCGCRKKARASSSTGFGGRSRKRFCALLIAVWRALRISTEPG